MRHSAPPVIITVLLAVLVLSVLANSTTTSQDPVFEETSPRVLRGSGFPTEFPWPMFHNNPQHTGYTSSAGPNVNSVIWSVTTSGPVTSPAILDGRLFIGSTDGNLYAYAEHDGGQAWTWTAGGIITSSPAADQSHVYFGSSDGTFYALDSSTGQLTWSISTIGPVESSPTLSNGRVFFGTTQVAGSAQVLAVNATTGIVLWTFTWSASITTSPAINAGRVFVATSDGSIIALTESSGNLLWTVGLGAVQLSSPAVNGGRVYVMTSRNRLVALSESTGSTIWQRGLGGPANPNPSSPAVGNSRVLVGTGAGEVVAVDESTGTVLWRWATGGVISSSPAITSGMVLAGSPDGNLYALNDSDGSVVWTFTAGASIESSPAIADGRAFFGSSSGIIYAIGTPFPRLTVSLSAQPDVLRSGQTSKITITVIGNSVPQSGARIVLTVSLPGGLIQPIDEGAGVYTSFYTAPEVVSETPTTLTAIGSKTGFLDGSAQLIVLVQPPSLLSIKLTSTESSLSPGKQTTLDIRLSEGTTPVSGATIAANDTVGGIFGTVQDKGDGDYSISYTAPNQNFTQPTPLIIVAAASKPGYRTITSYLQLVIYGQATTPQEPFPIPFLPIGLGAGVAVGSVAAVYFLRRPKSPKRRKDPIAMQLRFKASMLEALDEAFNLVGQRVTDWVCDFLYKHYSLKREEFPGKLELFAEALDAALGDSSRIIKDQIIKSLYALPEIPPTEPPSDEFVENVRYAQLLFEGGKPS